MSGDPYESGPFCRHWSEVGECDEKCSRCGHLCSAHPYNDAPCYECDCTGWQDTLDIPSSAKETPK